MKHYTKIASLLFGLAAVIHIVRRINPFEIIIAGKAIPSSASIAVVIIAIVFCVGLWKESKQS